MPTMWTRTIKAKQELGPAVSREREEFERDQAVFTDVHCEPLTLASSLIKSPGPGSPNAAEATGPEPPFPYTK